MACWAIVLMASSRNTPPKTLSRPRLHREHTSFADIRAVRFATRPRPRVQRGKPRTRCAQPGRKRMRCGPGEIGQRLPSYIKKIWSQATPCPNICGGPAARRDRADPPPPGVFSILQCAVRACHPSDGRKFECTRTCLEDTFARATRATSGLPRSLEEDPR
jgi:hypothetical protein